MRAFTFACQITNLIVQKWIDYDKYCATRERISMLCLPGLLAVALDEQQTGNLLGKDTK